MLNKLESHPVHSVKFWEAIHTFCSAILLCLRKHASEVSTIASVPKGPECSALVIIKHKKGREKVTIMFLIIFLCQKKIQVQLYPPK